MTHQKFIFTGKRLDNGQMATGSLIEQEEKSFICSYIGTPTMIIRLPDIAEQKFISPYTDPAVVSKEFDLMKCYLVIHEVDPESIDWEISPEFKEWLDQKQMDEYNDAAALAIGEHGCAQCGDLTGFECVCHDSLDCDCETPFDGCHD